MVRLDRAVVIPRDSTDLNQLTALMHSHPWMVHVDKDWNPMVKVGQPTYFFFNVDRVHCKWSQMPPIEGDPCVTVNEVATQLKLWATQPRYNKQH